MNIIPNVLKKNIFNNINSKAKMPSTEELINRGFDPKNDKIDILFINPPSTISERYGEICF